MAEGDYLQTSQEIEIDQLDNIAPPNINHVDSVNIFIPPSHNISNVQSMASSQGSMHSSKLGRRLQRRIDERFAAPRVEQSRLTSAYEQYQPQVPPMKRTITDRQSAFQNASKKSAGAELTPIEEAEISEDFDKLKRRRISQEPKVQSRFEQ